MEDYKLILEAAIGGVVATLLTGLYNSTPQLVGATWYGFPFTWVRRQIVGPQYNPWQLDFMGLVLDLFVWFVIICAVLWVASKRKRK